LDRQTVAAVTAVAVPAYSGVCSGIGGTRLYVCIYSYTSVSENGTRLFRRAVEYDGKVESLPAARRRTCSLFCTGDIQKPPDCFEKFMDRLCDF